MEALSSLSRAIGNAWSGATQERKPPNGTTSSSLSSTASSSSSSGSIASSYSSSYSSSMLTDSSSTSSSASSSDGDTRDTSRSISGSSSQRNSLSRDNSFGGASAISNEPSQTSTSFAGTKLASKHRNSEFHRLFPQIPADEPLVADFGCALARDILRQGRLYISTQHVCFYSNLFGYVVNVVFPITAITKLEKKLTAGIFPNALMIYVKKNGLLSPITSGTSGGGRKPSMRSRSSSTKSLSKTAGSDDEDRLSFHSFVNRETVLGLVNKLRKVTGPDGSNQSGMKSGRQVRLSGASGGQSSQRLAGSPASTSGGRTLKQPNELSDSDSDSGSDFYGGNQSYGLSHNTSSSSDLESSSIDQPFAGFNRSQRASGRASSPEADRSMPVATAAAAEAFRTSHEEGRSRKSSEAARNLPNGTVNGTAANGEAAEDPELGPSTHAPTKMPAAQENEKVLATETVEGPLGQVASLLFGSNTDWIKHFLQDTEKNFDLSAIPKFDNKKRYFEYTKPLGGAVGPKQTRCKSTETIEHWDLDSYVSVLTQTVTPDVPSGNAFTTMTRTVLAWGEKNTTVVRLGTWLEWSGKSWLKGPIEKGATDGQSTYAKDLVAALESTLEHGSHSPPGTTPSEAGDVRSSKEKKHKKHKRAKAKTSSTKETASTSSSSPAIIWQTAVFAVVVVLVVFWLARHFMSRSSSSRLTKDDLRFVEQELQLWQWIDDRSHANIQRQQLLQDSDMEEVIRITERRLRKLKEALSVKA